MKIHENEVLRYLGHHGGVADEGLSRLIGDVQAELDACVTPKNVYQAYRCQVTPTSVAIAGAVFESKSLSKHLAGCEQVVLLAATLGMAPDILMRRYSVSDITRATVVQAVCAALCESYCDDMEQQIAHTWEGLFLRPRFSPGYGDFSLSHQKDFLRLLDGGKRLGLSVTESDMLIPSKSVTAIIGISDEKSCAAGKCETCGQLDCTFRRG